MSVHPDICRVPPAPIGYLFTCHVSFVRMGAASPHRPVALCALHVNLSFTSHACVSVQVRRRVRATEIESGESAASDPLWLREGAYCGCRVSSSPFSGGAHLVVVVGIRCPHSQLIAALRD